MAEINYDPIGMILLAIGIFGSIAGCSALSKHGKSTIVKTCAVILLAAALMLLVYFYINQHQPVMARSTIPCAHVPEEYSEACLIMDPAEHGTIGMCRQCHTGELGVPSIERKTISE